MKTRFPHWIWVLLQITFCQQALAQITPNDDCFSATPIQDVEDFCTPTFEQNNFVATPSNVQIPSCWNNAGHDVWYVFTATATKVVVVINGNSFTPGGSLPNPGVALYSGDCGNLTELGCENDFDLNNICELRVDDLTPGQTYFLRVDGGTSTVGTFQLCIRNFFFENPVSGDCPTAPVVCNKESFNVEAVTGPGTDFTELNDAPCFLGINGELNSTWFVFTAANDGTLEFTLSPNNPGDDLDFVVYRLPNGPGNCSGKILERCMAAGDFAFPSPCMGPTGLNSTATDISQDAGCFDPLADNFLKFVDMTAGTTYALVVNNFTSSGNGFQVDWGGTGDFVGPVSGFESDETDGLICTDEEIVFTDTTTISGATITAWEWNFGVGANPATANTEGPHTVTYDSPGPKTALLSIKTSNGCVVNSLYEFDVEICCNLMASVSTTPACENGAGGTASISVENATPPLEVQWSDGQTDSVATNLAPGQYSVFVLDFWECIDSVTFTIDTKSLTMSISPDTTILKGTSINLNATTNEDGESVIWLKDGQEVGQGNTLNVSPDTTTTYFAVITVEGCVATDSVTVEVIEEQFEIPNAFTPNGDSNNDSFFPVAKSVVILEWKVWSRWGELVWEGTSGGWNGMINGNPAPSDVYVYYGRVRRLDGKEESYKGDVVLLR